MYTFVPSPATASKPCCLQKVWPSLHSSLISVTSSITSCFCWVPVLMLARTSALQYAVFSNASHTAPRYSQERFGIAPGWLVASGPAHRHGLWVGQAAPVPVPWVSIHIHTWQLTQSGGGSKMMVRKVWRGRGCGAPCRLRCSWFKARVYGVLGAGFLVWWGNANGRVTVCADILADGTIWLQELRLAACTMDCAGKPSAWL